MARAEGVERRSGPAMPWESEEAGGGLHIHLAELPVGGGQHRAVGVGSPHTLRRPQASPGPLFSPYPLNSPPLPFQPQGAGTQVGNQTYLGATLLGAPHSEKLSCVSSWSLFPYLGGERQLGKPALCPSASPPASGPPWGPSSRGTRAQAWSAAWFREHGGGRSWDRAPSLWDTPGPGQHVDVSAELSCILGQLLWRGIVPWVHRLQRGPRGTQRRLQQQGHTRGQEQQGQAVASSSHLRSKEWEGIGGRTELPNQPLCLSPTSPSLRTRERSKEPLGPDHPTA